MRRGKFTFTTTAELPDNPLVIGQRRAVEAIEFSIGVRADDYNAYAIGPAGTGKHTIVRQFLEHQAAREPAGLDWCYVHNFDEPHRPRAIPLPTGTAVMFRTDVARLIEELKTAISAALDTDEYRQRHQQIHGEFEGRRDRALEELRGRAAQRDVGLIRTPLGLALAPMRDGNVVEPDAFAQLPEAERQRLRATGAEFETELERILHEVPKWHRDSHEKIRALKRAATKAAVDLLIDEMKKAYERQPEVQAHLASLEKDVIDHADDFLQPKEAEEQGNNLLDALAARTGAGLQPLGRYQVNLLNATARARVRR